MVSQSLQPNIHSPESIESSIARLEAIVEEIDNSAPQLEIMIDRYEEGMKLLQLCREKLNIAEQRIEKITRSAQGSIALESFETS